MENIINKLKPIGVKLSEFIKIQLQMQKKFLGIKNQTPIKFTPEELVVNDVLLNEFSPTDVRALTYCALQNKQLLNPLSPLFKIISQEVLNNKTLFIIKRNNIDGEFRLFAEELFASDKLEKFNFEDMRTIIYTATFEQTLSDLE